MPRRGRRSKAKPLMIDQLEPSLEEKCAYYLAKGLPPDADTFDRVCCEAMANYLAIGLANADRRAGGGSISWDLRRQVDAWGAQHPSRNLRGGVSRQKSTPPWFILKLVFPS